MQLRESLIEPKVSFEQFRNPSTWLPTRTLAVGLRAGRAWPGIVRDQKSALRHPSLTEAVVKCSGAAQDIFDSITDAFALDRWRTDGDMPFKRGMTAFIRSVFDIARVDELFFRVVLRLWLDDFRFSHSRVTTCSLVIDLQIFPPEAESQHFHTLIPPLTLLQ